MEQDSTALQIIPFIYGAPLVQGEVYIEVVHI